MPQRHPRHDLLPSKGASANLQVDLHEQMLKVVTKKFSGSAKAWLAHVQHCIAESQVEAAQKVLERALASIPKHKHIKVRHAAGCSADELLSSFFSFSARCSMQVGSQSRDHAPDASVASVSP